MPGLGDLGVLYGTYLDKQAQQKQMEAQAKQQAEQQKLQRFQQGLDPNATDFEVRPELQQEQKVKSQREGALFNQQMEEAARKRAEFKQKQGEPVAKQDEYQGLLEQLNDPKLPMGAKQVAGQQLAEKLGMGEKDAIRKKLESSWMGLRDPDIQGFVSSVSPQVELKRQGLVKSGLIKSMPQAAPKVSGIADSEHAQAKAWATQNMNNPDESIRAKALKIIQMQGK